MNNPWIGILGAFVGALIGWGSGFLNLRYQLRKQEERERNNHFIKKLEELHEALSDYIQYYDNVIGAEIAKLTRKNEQVEIKANNPLAKIEMLYGLYVQELSDGLYKIYQCREEIGEVLISSFHLNRQNNPSESERKRLTGYLLHLNQKMIEICREAQREIVKESQTYIKVTAKKIRNLGSVSDTEVIESIDMTSEDNTSR